MELSKINQIKTSKHLAYAVKTRNTSGSKYSITYSAKGKKYKVTITETFTKDGNLIEAKYEVRGFRTGQIAFFQHVKMEAAA